MPSPPPTATTIAMEGLGDVLDLPEDGEEAEDAELERRNFDESAFASMLGPVL